MTEELRIVHHLPKAVRAAVLRLVPGATRKSLGTGQASARRDQPSLMARRLVVHRLNKQGYSLTEIAWSIGLSSHGSVHAMIHMPKTQEFWDLYDMLELELERP